MSIEQLVADNEQLVPYMLKIFRCDDQYDEILAAGRVGLIMAARTYAPERGKFAGYACKIIMQQALKFRRKADFIRQPVSQQWSDSPAIISLDMPCGDDSEASLIDTLTSDCPEPCCQLARLDKLRLIRRALGALSRAQRQACLRVLRGKSLSNTQRQMIAYLRKKIHTPQMLQLREACNADT